MVEKVKIVWICNVSNEKIRSHLTLGLPRWNSFIRTMMHLGTSNSVSDNSIWNTNALIEFEKIKDVDLHVIFVHERLRNLIQVFEDCGIHYYAVNIGDTSIINNVKMYLKKGTVNYKKTWKTIGKLVYEINPDLIHIMGAENPSYSPSIFYLPSNIPVLVQLQTMLQGRYLNLKESDPQLKRQIACERDVLLKADYIGSKSKNFPVIVRNHVRKDAVFVNSRLHISEKPNFEPCHKQFDFVYFANFINKSVDLAIEAFGIAYKKNPSLLFDIIGGVTEEEKKILYSRMEALGCKEAVTIEGKLPTHNDVLSQIKKSRFALLPLKLESVSSTIREAMWNGLPVITTETSGTPFLNKERMSILISSIGDHKAMADNMLRLVNDPEFAKDLAENAAITVEELYGNNPSRAKEWVETYYACIENYNNGTFIPEHILNNN